MDNDSYEKELMQIRRDLRNVKVINEDTYTSLQMTDNYLDKYLKAEILNEVIETLFCTSIDHQQMLKIQEFAKLKCFEVEHKIRKHED